MKDIPPKLRLVLCIAALGGLIFIIMGSLAAPSQQQIALDKVVHGTGYALLGLLVVMGLPPVWYGPALAGIAAAGLGLEYAQKSLLPGRSFDFEDAQVNSVGLLVGAGVGFLLRVLWGYVGGELSAMAERKRLRQFREGRVLFRQGDPSDCFYLIRKGRVEIFVRRDGAEVSLATLGVGEVVGEMGVIEGVPRSATAVVRGLATLYRMERSDLEEKVGDNEHPALTIARVLTARLRAVNAQLGGGAATGDGRPG